MMNFLAITGGLSLSICSIPQMIYTIQTGDTSSFSYWFLGLWAYGELALLICLWQRIMWPIKLNYLVNLIITLVILYYKIFI